MHILENVKDLKSICNYLKKLEKEEQIKSKVSRRNNRVEINKIQPKTINSTKRMKFNEKLKFIKLFVRAGCGGSHL